MTHISGASRRLSGILLCAVLPFAAACGADTATATASATSVPRVSTSTPAATSAVPTTTASAAPAAASGYCAALRTGQAELEGITGTLGDPAAVKAGLAALGKMQAAAPAELKPAWADFIELIKVASADDPSALATAADKADKADVAMKKIQQHAKAECGFTLF